MTHGQMAAELEQFRHAIVKLSRDLPDDLDFLAHLR